MPIKPIPPYAVEAIGNLPKCEPVQSAARALAYRLKADSSADVLPGSGESLTVWFDGVSGQDPIGGKLRLVVGESRGEHRGNRSEWWGGKMVQAASSDGAAGSELGIGLYSGLPKKGPSIDYKFLIDEWATTPDEVTTADLLVIGTGEVNILAAFLQALVRETIRVQGLADSLVYFTETGWRGIPRDLGGSSGPEHPGSILLLKNPWNLKKRLLWVAAHWKCHGERGSAGLGAQR